MDKQDERNRGMAKRMTVFLAAVLAGTHVFGAVTNLSQCVGIELTAAVLAEFPERDNSSPAACVLGFVKGSVSGDFSVFLTPLSDDLREEEAGVSDLSMLTPAMTNDFLAFVTGAAFSNHVVQSHSAAVSQNEATVEFSMCSQSGMLVKTNRMQATLLGTGNEWRITAWDVDDQ